MAAFVKTAPNTRKKKLQPKSTTHFVSVRDDGCSWILVGVQVSVWRYESGGVEGHGEI